MPTPFEVLVEGFWQSLTFLLVVHYAGYFFIGSIGQWGRKIDG